MTLNQEDVLAYYTAPGLMTSFKRYSGKVEPLPADLLGLRQVVQGWVVHVFWAERYGLKLSKEREAEVQIRPAHRKLARLLQLDASPLDCARPLERKLVGNCRDISVLYAALLRAKGIPARARCGFGTYFLPDHFEDHWVCEVWDADDQRWRWIDAQLDGFQVDSLKINFDPLDMPPGKFITGGLAWQLCREGYADPEKFGIFQWHGLDFIRGNLVRDLLALNKVEVLPWDFWGALKQPVEKCTPGELAWYDRMADLTIQMDAAFDPIRAMYEKTPRLHPPKSWAE